MVKPSKTMDNGEKQSSVSNCATVGQDNKMHYSSDTDSEMGCFYDWHSP